eukprot:7085928-Prymnesium_polylepis.1
MEAPDGGASVTRRLQASRDTTRHQRLKMLEANVSHRHGTPRPSPDAAALSPNTVTQSAWFSQNFRSKKQGTQARPHTIL